MKRSGFRLMAVAALIVAAIGAWQLGAPRGVFARSVRAMIEAKGYRCDVSMVPKAGGVPAGGPPDGGTLCWSSGGAERSEWGFGGKLRAIEIRRPGEPGLRLMPEQKQYQVLSSTYAPEFSVGLFARLDQYTGKAGRPASSGEVGGRKAEEYVVPWSRVVGDDARADATMHVWIDPETSLPLRVDITGMDPTHGTTLRLDNFRWGEQDRALFDTTPPEGYAQVQPFNPPADEITRYVVLGLSTFAKYNDGRYPAVNYVYGDEQGEALRKRMGVGPKARGWVKPGEDWGLNDPKEAEFAHASYGMSWINTLQRDRPDCRYRGKAVTAAEADANKVLLRWKLDDGRYRVIFGDLKAETMAADRLEALEAL